MSSRKISIALLVLSAFTGVSIVVAEPEIKEAGQNDQNQAGNLVEDLEYQERIGNVARTDLYIITLSNGSEFRYTRRKPGPGSLCYGDSTEDSCETRTEEGFLKINKATERGRFQKSGSDGITTYYSSPERICAKNTSSENLEIENC